MLNFALSSIPKRGKNASSIYPAFNVRIFVRNNGLTSEESEAKSNIA